MSVSIVMLWAVLPLAAWAAWTDFCHLRIPNWVSLAALALFLAFAPMLSLEEIGMRVLAAALVFAILFMLFATGLVGAGDVKLLSVLLLFVPSASLAAYLNWLAAAQAVALAAVVIAQRLPRRQPSRYRAIAARGRFPMGVAIGTSVAALAAASL